MSDATVAPLSFSAAHPGPMPRPDGAAGTVPTSTPDTREQGRARLFGQFLLDNGAVTRAELSAALELMAALNETIGDLAVGRGWLSRAQADHIAGLQRTIDARWGDIAVALDAGGLRPEQVEQLLWEQTADNLRIGDALVEVGALSCSGAEDWLGRYEASRAVHVVMADDPTGHYDPVRHAVDGLPRVLLRRAGIHAACSVPRVWRNPRPDSPARGRATAATIHVSGGWSVTMGLLLSRRLGQALASRGREVKDREVKDRKDSPSAVACDLLEVLAYYVARRLDRQADDGLGPAREVCVVANPMAGPLPERGLSFTVATDFGDAVLVLDQR